MFLAYIKNIYPIHWVLCFNIWVFVIYISEGPINTVGRLENMQSTQSPSSETLAMTLASHHYREHQRQPYIWSSRLSVIKVETQSWLMEVSPPPLGFWADRCPFLIPWYFVAYRTANGEYGNKKPQCHLLASSSRRQLPWYHFFSNFSFPLCFIRAIHPTEFNLWIFYYITIIVLMPKEFHLK